MRLARRAAAAANMRQPDYMTGLTYDDPTHCYRMNGRVVPHITGVIPSDYSHVPPRILKRAQERGTAVHKLIEHYILNTPTWPELLTPELEPYLESWIKAEQMLEIHVEPEDVERILYHPEDGYAGRGDLPRCYVLGELATLELKTIAQMTSSVDLQTAAQRRAENRRCRELGLPLVKKRWGVQVRKDGSMSRGKNLFEYTDDSAEHAFVAKLVSLKWDIAHEGK